ncbi:MAG TPA: efflux transporter outer membrane subunit [Candidatus Omnitrophota bacterium]|nr:efflux transporter outer membrane subunit [Candidatus Omnitrophota bacterium]HPT06693.1 efflux transporter outer membrane subunit [Candidatus Omnitrophota bacterium]
MKTIRVIPIIGAVILLSGCTLSPKYTRSVMPVPAEFPSGEAYMKNQVLENALSLSALKWQDVFTDPKLQKIIDIALLNNRDLRIAVLNVERARGMYGIQSGELYPALSASASGTEQHVPGELSSSGKAYNYKKANVDLGVTAWEVDFFGRIRSLKKQALEEYLAAEQVQRVAQTVLISEVARVYLTLAADLENLKLAQSTLESQRNEYDLIKQQFDKGIASEPDLRRSQTQVDTVKRDFALYMQKVAQDKNALNVAAGFSVPEDLLPIDLTSVGTLKDINFELSSTVLLRRPDIMAAEHRLIAAHAYIGAARAAFFPQISLTSVIGTASTDLSGLFAAGTKEWTFAPQAAMAIFDTRIFAAYKVSKADRKIALAEYDRSIQTAFREVADCLAVRGTVDQELSAQESIVDSAKIIYELSNQRYLQGVDGYLSVLDAQRSLYSAQQQRISLRLTKLANHIKFYAALGGDSQPVNSKK